MEKYRSIDQEYVPQIIKEYTYWTLSIHDSQRYLGRAYVWLVRPGEMQRFSEISEEEMAELRIVMREYEAAVGELWHPDFMNYAWLANLFHQHGGHGHMHLIPRYKTPRSFEGVEFVDDKWGQNCHPTTPFPQSEELVFKIRDAIKDAIAN